MKADEFREQSAPEISEGEIEEMAKEWHNKKYPKEDKIANTDTWWDAVRLESMDDFKDGLKAAITKEAKPSPYISEELWGDALAKYPRPIPERDDFWKEDRSNYIKNRIATNVVEEINKAAIEAIKEFNKQ